MKHLALGLGLVCLSVAARAEQSLPTQPVNIVITKVDCSRLIRHMPAADVAYRPGVDARGRAVAPADMPGSGADAIPNLLPDVLEFPITINPISYGARNQAQREKAAAAQGTADTYNADAAQRARVAELTAQKAAVARQGATLATEKAAVDAKLQTLTNDLAQMKAEIAAGTRSASDMDYARAKQSLPGLQQQVAAKTAAVSANDQQLATADSALTSAQTQLSNINSSPLQLSARGQIASLTTQKTELTAKANTLAGEKAVLDAKLTSLNTDLTQMKAEIAAGTRLPSDREYQLARQSLPSLEKQVADKASAIAANDDSLSATTSAIAAQQAIVDNAPDKAAANAAAQAAADAKLAKLSSKGLDSTTMNVGTVRYDMAKGTFTFNGEPLGGAEQEELARACQKQGVR